MTSQTPLMSAELSRRGFLTGLGVAGAGLALAACAPSSGGSKATEIVFYQSKPEVIGYFDDLIEQFVHCLKVGPAHMPVRLLAVDGESSQVDNDRSEKLGHARDGVRVDGTLGNDLGLCHCVTPFRSCLVQRYATECIPQAS